MASNQGNWLDDIINDFIHSSIWLSPIQTFIDTNCACFDYDDDIEHLSSSLLNEQKIIYKKYEKLVNSLITSLSEDLKIDLNQLKNIYQNNHLVTIDESYEQLYSSYDFHLFIEMMKKKNLILQLQALVNLQLEYGLLKQTDTNDDQILQLLLQATSSSSSRKISTENSSKVLSDLKRRNGREVQSKEIKVNEPKTIDSIPEEVLREKLRELTINTTSSIDEGNASAKLSRQNFLKQQRDLIINKQRNERARDLEKEIINTRPQSAAKVARKAMEIANKQEEQISNDELEKRRAMAVKLRREVVDKK
jgi:hypothetical protein